MAVSRPGGNKGMPPEPEGASTSHPGGGSMLQESPERVRVGPPPCRGAS